MEQVTTILYVDVVSLVPPPEATAKQGDAGSRVLEIQVMQNGAAYDLTGLTAAVYVRKPDRHIVYNTADITGAAQGRLQIALTSQMLAVPGRAICEAVLYSGEQLLTTLPFFLQIIPKVHDDDAVESSDEFTALQEALEKIALLTPEGTVASNSIDARHLKTGAVTPEKLDQEIRDYLFPMQAKGNDSGERYVYEIQGNVDTETVQGGYIRILIDRPNPAGKEIVFAIHTDSLSLMLTPICSIYGETGTQTRTDFPAGFFQPNQLLTCRIYDGTALAIVDGLLPDYTAEGLPPIPLYGVCDTAADTVEKNVTIEGFTLVKGAQLLLTFTHGNEYSFAKLNVNGTGAKEIRRINDFGSSVFFIPAGDTVHLVYDGVYFQVIDIPDASVSCAGKVKLNDTLTSSSASEALTAAQGKALKDRIEALESRIAALEDGGGSE